MMLGLQLQKKYRNTWRVINEDLVKEHPEKFGLKKDHDFSSMLGNEFDDIVEKSQWIKVSIARYLWNTYDFVLTAKQAKTISVLMNTFKQEEATFGLDAYKKVTLEDAVSRNKDDYSRRRLTRG